VKAIVSILLSSLILLSSSGIAYAKHYCGKFEMLSKITLGEEHLSCGMTMPASACGDEKHQDHHCCSNTYLKVTTDSHFNKVTFQFNFQGQWIFIPAEVHEFRPLEATPQETTIFSYYRPPPLIRDYSVLY